MGISASFKMIFHVFMYDLPQFRVIINIMHNLLRGLSKIYKMVTCVQCYMKYFHLK